MGPSNLLKQLTRVVTKNSPTILTGLGVGGVITTAYLTGRAAFTSAEVIESDIYQNGYIDDPKKRAKRYTELTWRLYIPAGISGSIAIGCIIAGARVSSKRTAAAYSLLSVSQQAFDEYRDKVVEKFGEKKEQAIRAEIAQDRVNNNPPGQVIIGSGSVMCCELFTGRYFMCDIETLKKAEIFINRKILSETEATLDDFYYEVKLEPTTDSSRCGWDLGRTLELYFSAVLHNEKPCIAFEYSHVKSLK